MIIMIILLNHDNQVVQPCTQDGYTRVDVKCGCNDCYCWSIVTRADHDNCHGIILLLIIRFVRELIVKIENIINSKLMSVIIISTISDWNVLKKILEKSDLPFENSISCWELPACPGVGDTQVHGGFWLILFHKNWFLWVVFWKFLSQSVGNVFRFRR